MKIQTILISILVILSVMFNSCQDQSSIRVIKLAHVLDPSHPVHQGMVYMAEKLFEKSNGKMRVDIYPSGQLGAERDLIELLQIGSLAMTKVSTAPLEAFVPEMKIFGIPYVFRDDAHRWKILQGANRQKAFIIRRRLFFAWYVLL